MATTTSSSGSRSWLATLGPFLGLLAVIGVFALLTDTPDQYLSVRNFRIVVAQTVIVALGAIGMTMIIVSGGIDLSVGSVIALTGVVTAIAIRDGVSPLLAVVYSVLAGGVVGVLNGLLITRLRVIPFIATLGTLGMARGVAKWIAGQQTVNVPPTWVNELAVTFPQPEWLIVAPGVWLSIALAVLAALVLRYTVFGRRVFAIGSNEAAARACGIAVDRLKIWIYGLAGLLVRAVGRDADVAVAAGRSDRRHRHRTRHHRRGRHRRRLAKRRRGHDSRVDDRRDHHGRAAKRQPADGLAQLHPGNHHRRDHRDRRGRRRLALAPSLITHANHEDTKDTEDAQRSFLGNNADERASSPKNFSVRPPCSPCLRG